MKGKGRTSKIGYHPPWIDRNSTHPQTFVKMELRMLTGFRLDELSTSTRMCQARELNNVEFSASFPVLRPSHFMPSLVERQAMRPNIPSFVRMLIVAKITAILTICLVFE